MCLIYSSYHFPSPPSFSFFSSSVVQDVWKISTLLPDQAFWSKIELALQHLKRWAQDYLSQGIQDRIYVPGKRETNGMMCFVYCSFVHSTKKRFVIVGVHVPNGNFASIQQCHDLLLGRLAQRHRSGTGGIARRAQHSCQGQSLDYGICRWQGGRCGIKVWFEYGIQVQEDSHQLEHACQVGAKSWDWRYSQDCGGGS